MKVELSVDEHKGVGPLQYMYGHGPVTVISPEGETAAELFVCLDCGYMTNSDTAFADEECERAANGINQTWREYLEDEGYGDALPTVSDEY